MDTEISTSDDDNKKKNSIKIPYKEFIEYLNNKAGTNYKYNSRTTKNLIKSRFNQGFNLDDFKAVIDDRCFKWLHDPKMIEYLRPRTLFGTKFEDYLNHARKSIINDEKMKMYKEIAEKNTFYLEQLDDSYFNEEILEDVNDIEKNKTVQTNVK